MDVILLEKTRNLGNLGDKVTVKPGYGRNYLIPQGKAVSATGANLKQFESMRAELEQKAAATFKEAEAHAAKLNALSLTIEAMASDEGKLYGSVGTREITEAIEAAGETATKKEITLPNGSIHEIGEYDVNIQVHTDIVATVKVNIIPSKG